MQTAIARLSCPIDVQLLASKNSETWPHEVILFELDASGRLRSSVTSAWDAESLKTAVALAVHRVDPSCQIHWDD